MPTPALQINEGQSDNRCSQGSRRWVLATKQLIKNGRRRVAELRGGLSRWKAEGYPVELAAGEPTGSPQR
ncbi:MAG: hypothetical protein WBM08_13290 [Prochlorococcaceae cyanobacterium]